MLLSNFNEEDNQKYRVFYKTMEEKDEILKIRMEMEPKKENVDANFKIPELVHMNKIPVEKHKYLK